ncbi:DUF4112 domain-containing protein [Pontibacter sp. JH31]|uniref:DUF4112 domain-containing protein n=1 Tax=Pontibacter aquaedesilientis TaxID=2766980 RepID=A0ABR7XEE4_9BACT|nr:DUF4112 domain-containing protein [Pontibacter aquaedesilientis]MBD1396666.1 DUF4112 domain-containing protein [Pontibacter aquaedesilientis]
MATANTHYTRTPQSENLKWVDRVTKLMDNQFRLPGTNWRFGLDPILGLFPVVGDLASFGVSAMLILTMARYGASGKMVTLMLLNIAVDALFGSIPILGNIFDLAFKANERNVRMLRAHYEEGKYRGSGKHIVIGVIIGIVVVLGLLLWAIWEMFTLLYERLGDFL